MDKVIVTSEVKPKKTVVIDASEVSDLYREYVASLNAVRE